MNIEGILVKMPTAVGEMTDVPDDEMAASTSLAHAVDVGDRHVPIAPVHYRLRLEEPRGAVGEDPADVTEIDLNRLVGRAIRIEHTGEYTCIRCGRGVAKLFGEGFCYPCFAAAPEAAECIVRPELCEAHLGRGRDPEWEEAHHNRPHAVYLAATSALKVGVTRMTQIPTRWIDQGAAWAVRIAGVPYRQLAGRIEVALKELYTDRTAWQRMLKGELVADIDLDREGERIRDHFAALPDGAELFRYLLAAAEIEPLALAYPLPAAPAKVKSVNLQKSPVVESTLLGVRGQYLILDGGAVVNVRRHSGFRVAMEW
ncbi:MAG: DUF2797 domain-containing protein [Spirochaetales bacterium]|nr:DUF2797 domain-containing protein [Spirochaetales bacterium]